jgi:hypothetical protein
MARTRLPQAAALMVFIPDAQGPLHWFESEYMSCQQPAGTPENSAPALKTSG